MLRRTQNPLNSMDCVHFSLNRGLEHIRKYTEYGNPVRFEFDIYGRTSIFDFSRGFKKVSKECCAWLANAQPLRYACIQIE